MKTLFTITLLGMLAFGQEKPTKTPLLWVTIRGGGSSGGFLRCPIIDRNGTTLTVQCLGNQPIKPGMPIRLEAWPPDVPRPPIPAELAAEEPAKTKLRK